MNEQDLMSMLAEYAQRTKANTIQSKTFADRLREERQASINKILQTSAPIFQGQTEVPMDTTQRFNREQAFFQAGQGVMQPVEDAYTRADKLQAQEGDLLTNLYQLSQKDKELSPGTVKSIVDPTTGETTYDYSNISADDALKIVNKDGRRLLSGGIGEKKSQAQAILQYGGVNQYLQQAPIEDIYSLPAFKNEKTAQDKASELLGMVDTAKSYFQPNAPMDIFGKSNLVGPIAGRKGFLRGKEQVAAQSALGEMAADKINKLSGAAVSPQEFERLKTFIPTATMQENEVATLLDSLSKRIEMNMKVREDAIRAGEDAGALWQKNKDKYLTEFGFNEDVGIPEVDIKSEVSKYWSK